MNRSVAAVPASHVDIYDVVRTISEGGVPTCRISGFVVVAEPGLPTEAFAAQRRAARMLAAFVGPYGEQTTTGRSEGIEWAGVHPGSDQVLSTWSTYGDERGLCLIEGDFYSDAWSYRPSIGVDAELAQHVMEHVLDAGPGQLAALNGLFSGVVYSRRHRRLWLFVDRLGTRLLYYRIRGGRCEASSNIYGFRASPVPPRVDAQALNEHLVLGSPTNSKTVFEGVRLVPPGKILEWSLTSVREWRYHQLPRRLEKQSLADGAEMICAALDRHMRNLPLGRPNCSLALSGGKDSRAVLAALVRTKMQPRAVTFMSGSDVGNALRLCASLGIPSRSVLQSPDWDPVAFHWDSAVLQDGYGAGWGFLSAAAAAALETPPVFTGLAGDYLSGSWDGVVPWRLSSPDALAMKEYAVRGAEVSPMLTAACLRRELVVPHEEVLAAWLESYRLECDDADDLLTTYILHRTSHRNRRRIVPVFHLMRSMCALVHPFADRFVMDAYLTLPHQSLIGQGVQCLVAMYGLPALGRVPTGSSRLPLKYEFVARTLLRYAKQARNKVQSLRRLHVRRAGGTGNALSLGCRRHLAIARESELFDPSALDSHADELAYREEVIIKLGATAIHVACLTGADLPSAPKPLFLKSCASTYSEWDG